MKLKIATLLCLLFLTTSISAQWIAQTSFPGQSRSRSTAFTIGDKIYLVGGYNVSGATLKDVWEYDINLNSWTQKNNFPGEERYGATSWVINGVGYIATGANDFGYLDDLWRYNQINDSWTQRSSLLASTAQHENQRREAFSFVIGNKAYLGGGDGFVFTPNSTFNYAFYDLWEYDAIANTWTPKSGVPDNIGRNMSIATSIGDKAYMGLGCNVNQTINHLTFWEYTAATDNWVSKASFPNQFTTDPSVFVLDSNLFIVGGANLNPVTLSDQVYKYDPMTDSWSLEGNFNGGPVAASICVSNGNSAFVGTGFNSGFNTRTDLWKLTSNTVGVKENLVLENLYLYPNPAGENISINSNKEIFSLEIYDYTGKLLFTEKSYNNKINVQFLNPGLYNICLTFSDGSLANKQFIKE